MQSGQNNTILKYHQVKSPRGTNDCHTPQFSMQVYISAVELRLASHRI